MAPLHPLCHAAAYQHGVRALQSGGIKVQNSSLSEESALGLVTAGGIIYWIVKAIPKLILCAVVYHIWGKQVAKDIGAIRRLLEEQRRDSQKR